MNASGDPVFARRTFLIATAAFAVTALTACAADGAPDVAVSALTAEQAERLATFRLKNYLATSVSYTVSGPESQPIDGLVQMNTQAHTGQGLIALGDAPAAVVVWGEKSVFTCVDPAQWESPSAWSGRDLGQSDIDSFLIMLLLLSSDRPENVQLLQQSGASWLGTETIGGVACDVFTGPGVERPQTSTPDPAASPVRYLLDADGVLQSFTARISADEASPWIATRSDTPPDVNVPGIVWDAMEQAAGSSTG